VALQPSDVWRAPRLQVLANGTLLTGTTEAIVTSTGWFAADTFRVRAALVGDAATWAATTSITVDVQMALDPLSGFVSMVQGGADSVILDPLTGVLTLEGRDRSAALIEARTQETFANRTASEIAGLLAARHGLAADAQATTTPVGRYWELEHDSLTLDAFARATTEWDLLVRLAGWEGFDVWVSGSTLHFRAPDTSTPPTVLRAGAMVDGLPDVTALRLERALSFAGDVAVTVKSWHSRLGSGCVQTAATSRGASQCRSYVFVAPNLTPDAAMKLAQAKLAETTAHEMTMACDMPGELSLSPRGAVRLAGTGTVFDRVYRVDEVERQMSVRRGFSQHVRARAASS
jgi:phage protein D